MSKKPPKTQQEIDDERIERQHKRSLLRGRSSSQHRQSHLAYKAHAREKTKNEVLDELENLE